MTETTFDSNSGKVLSKLAIAADKVTDDDKFTCKMDVNGVKVSAVATLDIVGRYFGYYLSPNNSPYIL